MTTPVNSTFQEDGSSELQTDATIRESSIVSHAEESSENGGFSGVHDVMKSVDYWFEREADSIEKQADAYARSWADENMPTLTQARAQALEPEQVLSSMSGALWRRWPERIQVKMQDAIDAAAAELGSRTSAVRGTLLELRVTNEQLRDAEGKVEEIRRLTEANRGPVRYARYFSAWVSWTLAILLVVVEFVANQPVFRLIWPMQSAVAAKLADRMESIDTDAWYSGILVALLETSSYVEASMLALLVVLLLYVLAKSIGVAVRAIAALRPADYPFASRSIESLHRQKKVLGAAAVLGTVCILAFLFISRGSADQIVTARVDQSRLQVQNFQRKADSVVSVGGTPSASDAVAANDARFTLERLENDQAFARTIAANNIGIFILNLSLVSFAFVVGFMSDERDLSDTMGEHPDLKPLKEKCVRLREQLLRRASEAREEARQADAAIGRLNSLLRARLLGTIDAKRERLMSIVPSWRAANAQLRGIDPSSIASFRVPAILELPQIDVSVRLVKPDGFDENVAELRAIRDDIYRAESGSDIVAAAA